MHALRQVKAGEQVLFIGTLSQRCLTHSHQANTHEASVRKDGSV